MAGCSGGSAVVSRGDDPPYPPAARPMAKPAIVSDAPVEASSDSLSGLPSSVMRASPDHLDGRVAGCDGDHGIGKDNDPRAKHPVHGWSLGPTSDLRLAARRTVQF